MKQPIDHTIDAVLFVEDGLLGRPRIARVRNIHVVVVVLFVPQAILNLFWLRGLLMPVFYNKQATL